MLLTMFQPYHGDLTLTDGTFEPQKRLFVCRPDCTVLLTVTKIRQRRVCAENLPVAKSVSPEHIAHPSDCPISPARSLHRQASENVEAAEERRAGKPDLKIGDRIVWFSDKNKEELGIVKWIGILPDSKSKEYTIGVEFVRTVHIYSDFYLYRHDLFVYLIINKF